MNMPAWMRQRVGDFDRAVQLRTCPRCDAKILHGLDSDRAGVPVRCDLTPLDEVGEAIAVITNRATYDLIPGRGRRELEPRSAWHISRPRRYPVIAIHKCGQPLPETKTFDEIEGKRKADEEAPPF
ncbi:hypothetical protein [Nonomuraea dietziae]|uniref:hypothetical protein n=1 Tax=Nonomuraea dietziae TaxID=65515 RepID=UPI00343B013F